MCHIRQLSINQMSKLQEFFLSSYKVFTEQQSVKCHVVTDIIVYKPDVNEKIASIKS